MKTPRVSDIVGIINRIAPFSHAEEWDNVGLQAGDPASPVEKIMVALDPGKGAVEAAVASRCQLLLTHHPLFFSPIKKITLNDPTGQIVALLLQNNLSILSLHTNYDIAEGGLNDLLAERLRLVSWEPLKAAGSDELVKLSVFVPRDHEPQVLESLYRFGARLGNYRDCTFRTSGVGTFTPLDGARPFLGQVGTREEAAETRIEVLLNKENISAAVNAMVAAHPYEEPAYDLYPLLNRGKARGLGRIGVLAEAVPLGEFAGMVKEGLDATGIRFVGDACRPVKKIAVCGGSGASLVKTAVRQGADVLVTGDIKYHDAREAEALGLALMDAGHFPTEAIMIDGVAARVTRALGEKGYGTEVVGYKGEKDPFQYV
ncbi:Nif3-like dinuclear metal center hexameric protein [Geotalea sp. SG265]|uniref:Nif3-like dinuclear metal center hexameric protein n=1 Tax=Geotalea sp. SG265 TaxID=2922867 RepID=UPI001FAFDAF2|nr:Nif3-like dinuclear metal center hexameric protein [Geotalea sp. SG265]